MSEPGLKHHLPGFDQALETLKDDVILMANLVNRNLANARAGFAERDDDFCAAVIADDDEVDLLEKEVDRLGTEILMRFQPMITDLRTVLATIKMGGILERTSNQAVAIARRSRRISDEFFPCEEHEWLLAHFDAVLRIFSEAVSAFHLVDTIVAGRVLGESQVFSERAQELVDKFTELLEERPLGSRAYVNLMAVAQCLEEITQLCSNIASEAVYIAEARDIRHPSNPLAETEE